MDGAKPVSNPCLSNTKLCKDEGDPFSNATLYRNILGALQYATITLSNISFSINKVCQFMHKPTISHWVAVKCILGYLKENINTYLLITQSPNFKLSKFSDADWTRCLDDQKSIGGYAIFLGPNLISWLSHKQCDAAHSSTEVEY